MTTNSDLNFSKELNKVKTSSFQQQLGEIEIKLGGARLDGDSEQVRDLVVKKAELVTQADHSAGIEFPYPAPLHPAAYYGVSGEIIKTIEPHTEADPVALLMNLLTAFGNIAGNGSWFKVGADRHPCNIFCVLVGNTAKGRKGTSWSPIRSIFEKIESDWAGKRIQTGLSSGEGLIYHVRDPEYRSVYKNDAISTKDIFDDSGITDKRLLILESELAQTLKVLSREGNTLSPVIRLAWDSGNLQTLTKNNPVRSTNAHISIIGHITRQELLRGLSKIETGNGFANRFLWLCVQRSKCLAFSTDIDSIDLEFHIGKLQSAVEYAKQAGRIEWANETMPLWEQIYPELSEGRQGIIGALTARAEAQVLRLASIYSLLDCSNEISPNHLKAALAVWSYVEASVRYIFQKMAVDPLANKIYKTLVKQPQGVTRTEINNILGRNSSSSQISDALAELVSLGLARSELIETGRRPAELWFSIQKMNELNE